MWATRPRRVGSETRALLARLRAHTWKSDLERSELTGRLLETERIQPTDIGWMVLDQDPALRQTGLEILQRFPFETGAEALFPLLGSRVDNLRRLAMHALEKLAGPSFPMRVKDFLAHPDPNVVDAALDHLKQNPSEQAIPWIAQALDSSSVAVRRKAFSILEATQSPHVAPIGLKVLADNDENLRFRAITLLKRYPHESQIEPLLHHSHNDSSRVQDAAISALAPLLSPTDTRWNDLILPLLTDANPKVRQLASKILATQNPATVADSFLRTFGVIYGLNRDRALEALRELGPQYIQAFLDRDQDPNPDIAALASSVAVTIRSPEVVPHCIRFLQGQDWWLRDRAGQVLAEIRDERALPALLKMLQDPESDISAAHALGVFGSPVALPGLLDAYKKGTKDLRLEILDAFARISDPRVPGLLESITRADPDPLVKEKAVRLIAERSGEPGPAGEGVRSFPPVDFAANPSPTLKEFFRHARAVGASDLHIAAGATPCIRVNGRLTPLPLPEMSPKQAESLLSPLLGPEATARLQRERQLDFCHKDPELGRFRTNIFHERKGINGVFRLVPYDVPNVTDIGLPESVWDLTTYAQGLVLVTGSAGCGKTTTLAALVDRINETERCHILTIEDPIEYVHSNKNSLVNQREVPAHSHSFARALRQSLREDPDVILVGEMRDLETISLAITAAETGHLVFATLHTTTASSTVDRVINAFPPDQQGQIRMMIADSLKAIISQALVPRRDGSGRVGVFEILRNTPNVAGLIREGKTFQIPSAIQTGSGAGMSLMDNALFALAKDGMVEPRVAWERALRKEMFEPLLPPEEGTAA